MTFAHIFESLSRPLGGHRFGGWQCEGDQSKNIVGDLNMGGPRFFFWGGIECFPVKFT